MKLIRLEMVMYVLLLLSLLKITFYFSIFDQFMGELPELTTKSFFIYDVIFLNKINKRYHLILTQKNLRMN